MIPETQDKQNLTGELIIPANIFKEAKETPSIADAKKRIETLAQSDISTLFNFILSFGSWLNASDIHFEPEEGKARLRFRVDGLLQDVTSFSAKSYAALASRIKLVSRLKLNLEDKPQDGRFSFSIDD